MIFVMGLVFLLGLLAIVFVLPILVLMYGWGLEPQSWVIIIGGGLLNFAILIIFELFKRVTGD